MPIVILVNYDDLRDASLPATALDRDNCATADNMCVREQVPGLGDEKPDPVDFVCGTAGATEGGSGLIDGTVATFGSRTERSHVAFPLSGRSRRSTLVYLITTISDRCIINSGERLALKPFLDVRIRASQMVHHGLRGWSIAKHIWEQHHSPSCKARR